MVSPQSLMHMVELPGGEIRNTPLHVVSVAVWPNGVEHQAPVQCFTEWLLNSASETKTKLIAQTCQVNHQGGRRFDG
tara:strand:+ start:1067 stop:1297 length:231 start_codon:yes stop_codon:yes gene_type:complete